MIKKIVLSLLILFLVPVHSETWPVITTDHVLLLWAPVTKYVNGQTIQTNDIVKYNVFRADNSRLLNLIQLNSEPLTNNFYFDKVVPHKLYYYQVEAFIYPELKSRKSNKQKINIYE